MYNSYEDHERSILNESLTVEGLIDALSKYPKDMKIITTWESTIHCIEKRSLYVSKDERFLYLDADACTYKEDFAKDPNENESN